MSFFKMPKGAKMAPAAKRKAKSATRQEKGAAKAHAARLGLQRAAARNYGAGIANKMLSKLEDDIPIWMDGVLISMYGDSMSAKKRAKFGSRVIQDFLMPWAKDLNVILVDKADKRRGRIVKKYKV